MFLLLLKKFWKEAIIALLCGVIGIQSGLISKQKETIKNQEVEYAVLDARCSANLEKIDDYNKGVEELAKKNELLAEKIEQSNLVIGKIGANGNKILLEIQKMKIPESCEGKLQWLRDQAVQAQGGKR